jgi:hypothetical protein
MPINQDRDHGAQCTATSTTRNALAMHSNHKPELVCAHEELILELKKLNKASKYASKY